MKNLIQHSCVRHSSLRSRSPFSDYFKRRFVQIVETDIFAKSNQKLIVNCKTNNMI